MKNKQWLILIISIIILLVVSIISVMNDTNNGWAILTSVLVILIPIFYSVIPLWEKYKLKIYSSKNRLSENTFTDRKEDLNKIIEMLSASEHIIEICGDSQTCGKTWFAKRIVDWINHPEDFNKKKFKFPYAYAYYVDC